MYTTWSGPEGSSHTNLCLCVPFLFMKQAGKVKTPEDWMKLALKEAEKARDIDEVPVGTVIVKNNELISKAHNLKEKKQQVYAHAEFLAIEKAARKLHNWCLDDCDLYVTLEPCMMCSGTISLSRIHHLYYGTPDPKSGTIESVIHLKEIRHIGVYPKEITTGILQQECSEILTDFFRQKRKKAKRDKSMFHKEKPADTE